MNQLASESLYDGSGGVDIVLRCEKNAEDAPNLKPVPFGSRRRRVPFQSPALMSPRVFPWLLALLLAAVAGVLGPRVTFAHSQAIGCHGVDFTNDSRDLWQLAPTRADLSMRSESMPAEVGEKFGGDDLDLAASVGFCPYARVSSDRAGRVAPTLTFPTPRLVAPLLC